jgi:hypothetical protein
MGLSIDLFEHLSEYKSNVNIDQDKCPRVCNCLKKIWFR